MKLLMKIIKGYRIFLQGGATINVLSKQVGAQVEVVDIGLAEEINNEDLIVEKIKLGPDNIIIRVI